MKTKKKTKKSASKIKFRKKNPIKRYENLTRCIQKYKCKSILEIGSCSGARARMMIQYALNLHKNNTKGISYYGFDLFEPQTSEYKKKEFNGKMPAELDVVYERLKSFKIKIKLFKGYSQISVPAFVKTNPKLKIDLIFIDGGHSIETIITDWDNIQPLIHSNTCICFDDYWFNPKENQDFSIAGCKALIDGLDRLKWSVTDFDNFDKLKAMDNSVMVVRPKVLPQQGLSL